MGKGRRKSTANKLQNISNRAAKSSEIAPKFKKNAENEFQDALARKDFDKAKQILNSSKNLEEWSMPHWPGFFLKEMLRFGFLCKIVTIYYSCFDQVY